MATPLTPRPRLPITKGRMAQSLGLIAYQQAQEDPLPIPSADQLSNAFGAAVSAAGAIGSVVANPLSLDKWAAAGTAAVGAATKATDIAQAVMSYKPLGAVFEFKVTQSRANRVRRGINSPREGFATVPGPITYSLQICIIELVSKPGQEDDLMKILTGGTNLMTAIQSAVDLASMPIYSGCWFSDSMVSYKLEANQLVVQDASMTVARVSPAAATALSILGLSGGEQTLIQNLPLVGNVISSVSKGVSKLF
jgi:hypothetical protein